MFSHDGLRRSVNLFAAFRVEQSDPARFYGLLASDSVRLLAEHVELRDALVVDVGAGPREFADGFRAAGARYVPIDLDPTVPSLATGGVAADAHRLPLADATVDVAFSSNLIEHVQDPSQVAAELVRVTRPGGMVFLSYTNWWSPWGGHETSPWHWLGGRRAVRRYTRKHGHPPKNRIGENLFAVSVAWGVRWARGCERVDVVAMRPRYLPAWAAPLVRIPVARELLSWNLLVLLRRR